MYFWKWPNIEKADPAFLRALYDEARARDWEPDAIAGVIAYESGFDPSARNPLPRQTATGLIQFIESTARSLGTSTAELRDMTALEQLPFILHYYKRGLKGRKLRGADAMRMGWGGQAANWRAKASTVLAEPGDIEHEVNPGMHDGGAVTIQSLKNRYVSRLRRARKRGVFAVPGSEVAETEREGDYTAVFAVGAVALGGFVAWRRWGRA